MEAPGALRTFKGPQATFIILLKHCLCIVLASALTVGNAASDPVWIKAMTPDCPLGHCVLYHHTLARQKCQFHLSSKNDCLKSRKIINFIASRPLNTRFLNILCEEWAHKAFLHLPKYNEYLPEKSMSNSLNITELVTFLTKHHFT